MFDSKKIVAKHLDTHKRFLESRNLSLTPATVLSHISKAKAKGNGILPPAPPAPSSTPSASQAHLPPNLDSIKSDIQYIVFQVYEAYQRTLRVNNALDFDDLLVYGVRLFRAHPVAMAWCRHILVDELLVSVFPEFQFVLGSVVY